MRNALISALSLCFAAPAFAGLDIPPIYPISNTTAAFASTTVPAQSLSVGGSHVLLGLTVTAPSSGYVLVFDATSAPADGPVVPAGCWYVPPPVSVGQSATLSMANTPLGVATVTGITVVFSTTGCFTKTGSAAFISLTFQ